MPRLSAQEVKAMRALYSMGVSNGVLAKAFGVDTSTVSYHTCNKTFRDKMGRCYRRLLSSDPDDRVVLHSQRLMARFEEHMQVRNADMQSGVSQLKRKPKEVK